jgi:hypothetical protein
MTLLGLIKTQIAFAVSAIDNGRYDEAADHFQGAVANLRFLAERSKDEAANAAVAAKYHDPSYPPRPCDREACGKIYTGPAVYCSFECALADA